MTGGRSFFRLARQAPRRDIAALLAVAALCGATEGLGALLLVPLLSTLQGATGGRHPVIRALLERLRGAGLPTSLGGLLAAFLALMALRGALQYARDVLSARLQHRLVDGLRERCLEAILRAEWRWIMGTRRSDHANHLLTDVSRVGVGFRAALGLIASVAAMPVYLAVAMSLSPAMTALAIVSGGVVLTALSGERRKALRLGNGLTAANRAMQAGVEEGLGGLKLAKILGSEGRHLDYFRRAASRLRAEQMRFVSSASLSGVIFQIGSAILLAGYLYAGFEIWRVPVPELLTLVLIFSRVIPLFVSAQQQHHQWLHAAPAFEEAERLLEECRAAAEPAAPPPSLPWPVAVDIRLENVVARYPDRERPALESVSLRLPVRSTTAIMGASGAGKSTLADVLTGLLAPDAGELLIDGLPASGSARLRWRRSTAYVPQEVFLTNDSVRNNLTWGLPHAREADLRRALERAAADFAFRLPQGLDTIIGDGGARLSGGERQRLALARALLKRPSLLILDEATSALDLENEDRVRRAVEDLHGDVTVVLIGHRLRTLEHADQVVVLEQGRVVAQGTWEQVRERVHAEPLGSGPWRHRPYSR
ncbi:MAG: ABC transporter ATP-binding protein [Elusimicrobia bacterium]|nr:ABC transporter ATP-binding protein [Elusimicrobiota bacterium]